MRVAEPPDSVDAEPHTEPAPAGAAGAEPRGVLLRRDEAATFEKVFTVTTQPTLEHLRDARNRWAHFDTIDATQASQDVREMQMLLADLGAVDEARRMSQIQRTLDLMVRSGRS